MSRGGTPIPDPDPTGEYPDGWSGRHGGGPAVTSSGLQTYRPSEVEGMSLDNWRVVEGNRFVDRDKVYVIDAMRGYGRWRRRARRLVRWAKWQLWGRPRVLRGLGTHA